MQDEIAQQSANIVSYGTPSFGKFGTSLQTQYWFGIPRNVQFSGMIMDVDLITHQTVEKQNDDQQWINYNRAIGSRYSAMEHLVPEQMFSTEETPAQGISAVKALAIAAAEGQKIYTITASNVEQVLGSISLGTETEQEIRNAAYAGKEITTHHNQIDFYGWIGEGNIILDPETGAGAYKIAGGSNGGFLDKYNAEFVGTMFIVLGILTPFYAGPLVAFFSVVITILAIFHLFITLLQTDLKIKENGCTESMSDMLWALTVSLFSIAKLPKKLVDKVAAYVVGFYSTIVKGAIGGASEACEDLL